MKVSKEYMTEKTINAERIEQLIGVFGSLDENVKKLEQEFQVHHCQSGNGAKNSR